MEQKLTDADLKDKKRFRDNTRWFSPVVLIKCGIQAIVTSMFSQYADGRLTEASLDAAFPDDLAKRYDLSKTLKTDDEGALWVDYVADLGDGFNSTYAVAYLLGKKSLTVEGTDKVLPRGKVLVMGGDEVYPFPNRDEYKNRMQNPYRYAFPDTEADNADHPKLFLIPGNHDWYDGLKLFLGMFCSGKETRLGSWRTSQHRSYFSIRLSESWWLWGFDTGVDDQDIDIPQAEYFKACAKHMNEKSNVILCSSVPIWTKVDDTAGKETLARGLDYIANIIEKAQPKAQIHAVLSGDSHHYSRYRAPEAPTQFITAGGGGAFLHPTHHLKESIPLTWTMQKLNLSLKTKQGPAYEAADTEACYPSKSASRRLALKNFHFFTNNFSFCIVIGIVYWLIGLTALTTASYNLDGKAWTNPFLMVSVAGLFFILRQYADSKKFWPKTLLGGFHALMHGALIVWLINYLPDLNHKLVGSYAGFWLFFVEMFIGGLFGGMIWGAYLIVSSWCFGVHHNDAFSAMSLTEYRNFLRMRIKGDELTVYSIGLDKVPNRKGWKINTKAEKGNQSEPVIVPKEELAPRLIEPPIVIQRT